MTELSANLVRYPEHCDPVAERHATSHAVTCVTPDCDSVTPLRVVHGEWRIDESAFFSAAPTAAPLPAVHTSHLEYLDDARRVPPATPAQRATSANPELPDTRPTLSLESRGDELSTLTTALVGALAPHRNRAFLTMVTLTAPPGRPIAPLLAFLQPEVLGAWLVVERARTGAEHVHGLLLSDTEAHARRVVAEYGEWHGLEPSAQQCKPDSGPLRGWLLPDHIARRQGRRENVQHRKNIYDVARYALAVGRHARKRDHEIPTAVIAWGALAGTDALSTWALVTPNTSSAPTVTTRLCRWCRPDLGEMPVALKARQHSCSPRCRKRKERSVTRASVGQVTSPRVPPTCDTSQLLVQPRTEAAQ